MSLRNQHSCANVTLELALIHMQEKLMAKNFNIKEEAGGSGKPIIKTFLVNVTNHNLKISLRWAGKGTTRLPISGVYGPMILAIPTQLSKLK